MSREPPADKIYIGRVNTEDDPPMQVGALQVEGIPNLTVAGTTVANDNLITLEMFYGHGDGRDIYLFSKVSSPDLDTQVDILVNAFLPELERMMTTNASGSQVTLNDDARIALDYLGSRASDYVPRIFEGHNWENGGSTVAATVCSLEADPQIQEPLGFSASRDESDGHWTWTQQPSGVIEPLDHTMGVHDLNESVGFA